jgi:hypothetical protein
MSVYTSTVDLSLADKVQILSDEQKILSDETKRNRTSVNVGMERIHRHCFFFQSDPVVLVACPIWHRHVMLVASDKFSACSDLPV